MEPSRKSQLVIHPLLIAVYPSLFLYAPNAGQLQLSSLVLPLLLSVTAAAALLVIVAIASRSWTRSGVLVSLTLLLFFHYGHARGMPGPKWIRLLNIEWVTLLNIEWITIFVCACAFTFFSRARLARLTSGLNLFAGILVAISAFQIGTSIMRTEPQIRESFNAADLAASAIEDPPIQGGPDIYLILLDSYARDDVLSMYYDHDNSEFTDYLKAKGFYVADRATANYNQTGRALSACLNLGYLDELAERVGLDIYDHGPTIESIKHSFVGDFLGARGYTSVAFETGNPNIDMESVDVYLGSGLGRDYDPFHNALLNTTPIPDLRALNNGYDLFDARRNRVLYVLNQIGHVQALNQSPLFVFAYIEVPHPPFVFGPNGEPHQRGNRYSLVDGNWLVKPGGMERSEYIRRYRDQLIFTNMKVREAVDTILANAKTPPVILIFGDHGPRLELNWDDVNESNHHESMSVLNALYLPGVDHDHLRPGLSPVNTFRIVFSEYFGQQYRLLPDRSYYSMAWKPYRFYDVTEDVLAGKPGKSVTPK